MQGQGHQLRMSLDTALGKVGGGLVSDAGVLMRTFYAGCKFILSPHNLFMGFLSLLSIFLASKQVLDISFKVEFSIFAAGCIFPTTFSVQAAFQRREQCLEYLAKLKSNIVCLFWHFIFYDLEGKSKVADEVRPLFIQLVNHIEIYARNPRETQITTIVDARDGPKGEGSAVSYVYDDFNLICDRLHAASEREFGNRSGKAVEGNTNRSWNYVHDAICAFEGLRSIRRTHTPKGLRLFCHFLINASCILLAPFWVSYCSKEKFSEASWDALTNSTSSAFDSAMSKIGVDYAINQGVDQMQDFAPEDVSCVSAYIVSLLFTFIVLTLYKVQMGLEDCFDGKGDDDINWDTWTQQLVQIGYYGEDGERKRAEGVLMTASG